MPQRRQQNVAEYLNLEHRRKVWSGDINLEIASKWVTPKVTGDSVERHGAKLSLKRVQDTDTG